MPELRKDPIIGRWVIISTERAKRPTDLIMHKTKSYGGFCPLCPGNEDKTPSEVFAFRDPDSPPNSKNWKLRVVPNKFPALVLQGETDLQQEGMYCSMNGIGVHEVIVETPDHSATASSLSVDDFELILSAYRHRLIHLKEDPRFKYISIFKNYGDVAGASLEHPHSQVIVLPVVPKRSLEEIDGSKAYFEKNRRCIYCDIIQKELENTDRVVMENSSFLAFEPYASRFPFETCILPKNHMSSFENTPEETFRDMAEILSRVLKKQNEALESPPYNYMLHTSPIDLADNEYYHWHLEIIPRLTKVAGFEWGSGFYINPTPPEQAAQYLRETSID